MNRHLYQIAVFSMTAFLMLANNSVTLSAADSAPVATEQCPAATPTMNPWSKKMPSGWWLKRHEDILALPIRKEAEIAFIGDSITDGWDEPNAGLPVWEKEFGPLKPINLGIVCDSSQHALWRMLNGEAEGMPNLKLFVIEIGVNNKGINRHNEEDIEKGIAALCVVLKQKAPHARILVQGVFPRSFGSDNSDKLNANLAKLADGEKVFFININSQLKGTEGAIADRVGHLTALGYQVWADSIRVAVKELMDHKLKPSSKDYTKN